MDSRNNDFLKTNRHIVLELGDHLVPLVGDDNPGSISNFSG